MIEGLSMGQGNFRYTAHCLRGHLYDEPNTRIDKSGYQFCRTCDRDVKRRKKKND